MSKPLYKTNKRLAESTAEQRVSSKHARKIRGKKIVIFNQQTKLTIVHRQGFHQGELIKIIRKKNEKFFQECLKEKDNKFGKTPTGKELRLEFMKEMYKEDGTSEIRGWIKKQIEKLEDKEK